MINNDSIRGESVLQSNGDPNWNKSLVRNLSIVLLNLFQIISPADRQDSILNKHKFYLTLAEVMSTFRTRGKRSPPIIWHTNPTKRWGTAFKTDKWSAVYKKLEINTDQILPPVPILRESNTENDFLADMEYKFNKWISKYGCGNCIPLRVVAVRFMIAADMAQEKKNLPPLTPGEFFAISNTFLGKTVKFTDFFFSEEQVKNYFKNVYYHCYKYRNSAKRPAPVSQTFKLALANQRKWKWNETRYTNLFKYPSQEVGKFTDFISKNFDESVINGYVINNGHYSDRYLELLHGQFLTWKSVILDEYRENPEAARKKYIKNQESKKRKRGV